MKVTTVCLTKATITRQSTQGGEINEIKTYQCIVKLKKKKKIFEADVRYKAFRNNYMGAEGMGCICEQ